MANILFSLWQDEIIDNRGKSEEEAAKSKFHFPFEFDSGAHTKAFIGWSGVAIFGDGVDVVKLAVEYAKTYQEYSEACGRCAPGRWGGRIIYDILHKIGRGE